MFAPPPRQRATLLQRPSRFGRSIRSAGAAAICAIRIGLEPKTRGLNCARQNLHFWLVFKIWSHMRPRGPNMKNHSAAPSDIIHPRPPISSLIYHCALHCSCRAHAQLRFCVRKMKRTPGPRRETAPSGERAFKLPKLRPLTRGEQSVRLVCLHQPRKILTGYLERSP
jgi:hypothetical protein